MNKHNIIWIVVTVVLLFIPLFVENELQTEIVTGDNLSSAIQTQQIDEGCKSKKTVPTEAPKENAQAKAQAKVAEQHNTKETAAESEPIKSASLPTEQPNEILTDELTCTLMVRCDTIFDNMDKINPEKAKIIPKDGIIFPETNVVFYEGESVFNVILREMKRNKIHFEFTKTPVYDSAYVEGIGNLYEFDVGELSGWMYKVNGIFPNYGCSSYIVNDGDIIEWIYTCDLGADIGKNVK